MGNIYVIIDNKPIRLDPRKLKRTGVSTYKHIYNYTYKGENMYRASIPKYKASLFSYDILKCARFIDMVLIKHNKPPIHILKPI
jgi:hypothetical protein